MHGNEAVYPHEYTSRQKTNKVPQTMIIDETSILSIKFLVKMLSFQLRGGLRMTSLSTGSTPRLKNKQKNELLSSVKVWTFFHSLTKLQSPKKLNAFI
jgi:hypothetical protein